MKAFDKNTSMGEVSDKNTSMGNLMANELNLTAGIVSAKDETDDTSEVNDNDQSQNAE